MASVQCHNPVDHTINTNQFGVGHNTTCGYQKPVGHHNDNPQNPPNKCNNSSSCCHRKDNEHSFTNKVKVMANSAYRKVADQMHHHNQHDNGHQPNTGPKPADHGTEGKKKEGGMSNWISRIGDHKKEKQSKKKGNKCKCKDESSSSSDSESDNEAHVKQI